MISIRRVTTEDVPVEQVPNVSEIQDFRQKFALSSAALAVFAYQLRNDEGAAHPKVKKFAVTHDATTPTGSRPRP